MEYPRIKQIGCNVHVLPEGTPYVDRGELEKILDDPKVIFYFWEIFGRQTETASGPYPWDVEATLELIISGEITGTQRWWD